MPSLLAQLSTIKLKRHRKDSAVSASNDRAPSAAAESEPTTEQPIRRSQRTRHPSAHKRESDEYEASSRGSSQPPSPSERQSGKKSKDVRGDRPGLIRQPANVRAAAYTGSPEPVASTGPRCEDTFVASQRPASRDDVEVVRISKAEAIRRTTAYIGADTSHLSAKTIQRLHEQAAQDAEEDDTGPMELEGGSAPEFLQSTGRVVLGSGHHPPTGRTTGDVGSPGGPDTQPISTLDSHAPEEPGLEARPADDTATEPESEPEIVELGPGDSISQQAVRTVRTPQPRPIAIPQTPHPAKTNPPAKTSDTATIDESDEEAPGPALDSDTSRVHKRQRLAHRSQSPEFHIPRPIPLASTHSARPSTRLPPLISRPSAPTTNSDAMSLSKLPPTSDPNAVLAWVAQLANQALVSHSVANQVASTSRQGTDQSNGPLHLLAKVLGEAQSHLVASPPTLRTKSRHYSPYPRHTDLVEDNAETLEAEAAIALGHHLPTLADFPGLPWRVASKAINHLLATTSTEGPFEPFGVVDEWSNTSYKIIWGQELPDTPLIKPPRELRALMVRRSSWFRGETMKRLRPLIPFCWDFINPPRTLQDLRSNRKRAETLLPNSFHCLKPETDEDPYEHPSLLDCHAAAFFGNPEALGMMFHDKFRPTPLPTIAMILTLVQHGIEEWRTGHFVKHELNAATQLRVYEAHLKGLFAYEKRASQRLRDYRDECFWYGVDHATTSEDDAPYQTITHTDRIRPDTPAADVVDTQARARGKARAVQ
ncbi:hypothetical protein FS749_003803 [Ceratobasidium sp. UAMH 11750]|nr:hypothetical protein FS749_003803 [Ceratobasidium sp. UAMH 11750]